MERKLLHSRGGVLAVFLSVGCVLVALQQPCLVRDVLCMDRGDHNSPDHPVEEEEDSFVSAPDNDAEVEENGDHPSPEFPGGYAFAESEFTQEEEEAAAAAGMPPGDLPTLKNIFKWHERPPQWILRAHPTYQEEFGTLIDKMMSRPPPQQIAQLQNLYVQVRTLPLEEPTGVEVPPNEIPDAEEVLQWVEFAPSWILDSHVSYRHQFHILTEELKKAFPPPEVRQLLELYLRIRENPVPPGMWGRLLQWVRRAFWSL